MIGPLRSKLRASRARIARELLRSARRAPSMRARADAFFQRWYGIEVPPSHFYNPLPDVEALEATRARWYRPSTLPRVEVDDALQRRWIERLAAFAPEHASLPSFDAVQATGYGEGYGPVEAMMLHSFIRALRPRRIVEVGSGVSTVYTLEAVRRNDAASGHATRVTCIEPHPRDRLETLAREGGVRLIADEVQNVELDVFRALDDGDLLFIDSTHVCKIDSDVSHLYLEVLPRLRAGVVVHIHDIPFPYLAFAPEHPLHRLSLLWNEAALVRALLCGNDDFEILVCQSILHEREPALLKRAVPSYDPTRQFPNALWLRKTRDVA